MELAWHACGTVAWHEPLSSVIILITRVLLRFIQLKTYNEQRATTAQASIITFSALSAIANSLNADRNNNNGGLATLCLLHTDFVARGVMRWH